MRTQRKRDFDAGMAALPLINLPNVSGRNGEELATDEAAVWKRVLNFRIALYLNPKIIFETHPGLGISTEIYKSTCPKSIVLNKIKYSEDIYPDLIDIDPFGQPWDTVSFYIEAIIKSKIVMISNGEAQAVVRNLKKAQRYPTIYYGKQMPKWVLHEYIPRLESIIRIPCKFFYAFPTTIRTIHTMFDLPKWVFENCPQWMWWLSRYMKNDQEKSNGQVFVQ